MSAKTRWYHHKIVRKAVTRPLWWWHKRRPWPVRRRVLRLPPRPVAPEAGTRLVTQVTPGDMVDAAWMAHSFLRHLDCSPAHRLALSLYLDSTDADAIATAAGRWQQMFPGSAVHSTWDVVERLADRAPAVVGLARVNAMGRKLAVLLETTAQSNVIYADSDVLMFRDAPEFAEAMRGAGPALFNLEVEQEAAGDPRILAHAQRLGWPPPARRVNAGLLFIPRGGLSLEKADALLRAGEHDEKSWHVEQSAVAVLLPDAQPLPRERYMVSHQGQFYGEQDNDYDVMVTRHYFSTVRHQMYARGMPLLWRQWRREKSP